MSGWLVMGSRGENCDHNKLVKLTFRISSQEFTTPILSQDSTVLFAKLLMKGRTLWSFSPVVAASTIFLKCGCPGPQNLPPPVSSVLRKLYPCTKEECAVDSTNFAASGEFRTITFLPNTLKVKTSPYLQPRHHTSNVHLSDS